MLARNDFHDRLIISVPSLSSVNFRKRSFLPNEHKQKTRFFSQQNSLESLRLANNVAKFPEPTQCGNCSIGGSFGIGVAQAIAKRVVTRKMPRRQESVLLHRIKRLACEVFLTVHLWAVYLSSCRWWTGAESFPHELPLWLYRSAESAEPRETRAVPFAAVSN